MSSKCTAYGSLLMMILAATSVAGAAPFVATNADSDPDTLVPFDTANPAAPASPLATLGGDFIRGLDLTDGLNGYYVSMASNTGGETGLFRLADGQSSKIGDVPFETTALGDLTLTPNADALYAALNPPGASCSLYGVSLTGQFDAIGPITLAGEGSTDISGLAMDPVDGTLYGLDNRSDSLVRIDPATGEAEKVGTGLGILAGFAGGLDFAPDGSMLYATTHGGRVYSIDVATGLAGESLGTLPFSTSAIAAVPEPASLLLIALGAGAVARRRG